MKQRHILHDHHTLAHTACGGKWQTDQLLKETENMLKPKTRLLCVLEKDNPLINKNCSFIRYPSIVDAKLKVKSEKLWVTYTTIYIHVPIRREQDPAFRFAFYSVTCNASGHGGWVVMLFPHHNDPWLRFWINFCCSVTWAPGDYKNIKSHWI